MGAAFLKTAALLVQPPETLKAPAIHVAQSSASKQIQKELIKASYRKNDLNNLHRAGGDNLIQAFYDAHQFLVDELHCVSPQQLVNVACTEKGLRTLKLLKKGFRTLSDPQQTKISGIMIKDNGEVDILKFSMDKIPQPGALQQRP